MRLAEFIGRIKGDRPSCLFLGQSYHRGDHPTDPLLEAAIKKYEISLKNEHSSDYNDLLTVRLKVPESNILSWLATRSDRIAPPKHLEILAGVAWSSVYTSAIDTVVHRALRNMWRNIEPVLSADHIPSDPRRKTNLHVNYLFGRVDRIRDDEVPPLSRLQYAKRIAAATSILSRLPEIVTPLGTLAIEGYQPSRDWLHMEQFYSALESFDKGQIHWFNWTEEDDQESTPYIADLRDRGILVLHEESLANILTEADTAGIFALGEPPAREATGREVFINNQPVTVPRNIWGQISNAATVVTQALFESRGVSSPEKRYVEFRNFLGNSDTTPNWQGFAKGFAFRRHFQEALDNTINKALRNPEYENSVVLLHGQSGTGKTVSLGQLAYSVASQRKFPVLFLEWQPTSPSASDIDAFCTWVEEEGASVTLLIWDGMRDPSFYLSMKRSLESRGRKVVIIGSTYKLDRSVRGEILIEADEAFSADEWTLFKTFFFELDPELGNVLKELPERLDGPLFLVALYRYLPETRAQLTHGLYAEAGAAARELRKRGEKPVQEFEYGALGLALKNAGLEPSSRLLNETESVIGNENISAAELLVSLVMVVSQFGLRVPIELLMRSTSHPGSRNVWELFREIDLFRWSKDTADNIFVLARHPLEAQILARRLGGPKSEIDLIRILISKIRIEVGRATMEGAFAADLMHKIGPNGPKADFYSRYYMDLVATLRDLRDKHGVESTYLMLQEATLSREYCKKEHIVQDVETSLDILENAVNVLEKALEILPGGLRNIRHKANILVEKAAILATMALSMAKAGREARHVMSRYRESRRTARMARHISPDSYFPTDVMLWAGRDVLQNCVLPLAEQLDIKADILDILETSDIEPTDLSSYELFQGRKQTIGTLLNDVCVEDEAFSALESIGSKAGYLLRARSIAGTFPREEPIPSDVFNKLRYARDYLCKVYDFIVSDYRCLHYLLKLWWVTTTKSLMFYGERRPFIGGKENLEYLIELLEALAGADSLSRSPEIMYLTAVAAWELGDHAGARAVWRQLQSETDYVGGKRRILKSYLSAHADGKPKLYHGQIQNMVSEKGRGIVFVEELRQTVDFFPRDFGLTEPQRGDSLEPFHVSFNYIGPLADATRFHQLKVSK